MLLAILESILRKILKIKTNISRTLAFKVVYSSWQLVVVANDVVG